MKRIKTVHENVAAEIIRMRVIDGCTVDEIAAMLANLEAETEEFAKGDVFMEEGAPVKRLGLILEGYVHLRRIGANGRPCLVHMMKAGCFFGTAAVIMSRAVNPISMLAVTDCTVLWLSVKKLKECQRVSGSCPFYAAINRQMFDYVAENTFRISLLCEPKLEDRVTMLLRKRCEEAGSNKLVMPGNEADLASYLGVHPVALSRALNRMKAKGLLDYRRNVITLLGSGS